MVNDVFKIDLSRSTIENIEAACLLVDMLTMSAIKLLVILSLLKYLYT